MKQILCIPTNWDVHYIFVLLIYLSEQEIYQQSTTFNKLNLLINTRWQKFLYPLLLLGCIMRNEHAKCWPLADQRSTTWICASENFYLFRIPETSKWAAYKPHSRCQALSHALLPSTSRSNSVGLIMIPGTWITNDILDKIIHASEIHHIFVSRNSELQQKLSRMSLESLAPGMKF